MFDSVVYHANIHYIHIHRIIFNEIAGKRKTNESKRFSTLIYYASQWQFCRLFSFDLCFFVVCWFIGLNVCIYITENTVA